MGHVPRLDDDLGQVEGRGMVELILRLPEKHRSLLREGVHHTQQGEHELREDEQEAAVEPWLHAAHVALQP